MNQNEYSNYYEEFGWYGPLDETIYENTLYFVSSLAFEPFEYCNPGLGCTSFNNGTGLESGPWIYSYQSLLLEGLLPHAFPLLQI